MAETDIMQSLDKILQTYKTGGDFATQREAQLKGTKRKYTAGAQQNLVSRGLSGTTVASSIPSAFEQEIGAPYRTETERLRSGQEMQGLIAKAGFLQAGEDRALRERMATAERESREKMAKDDAAARVRAAQLNEPMPQMSTFASREAKRKSEQGGAGGTGGAAQHLGGSGTLNFQGSDFSQYILGETGATGGGSEYPEWDELRQMSFKYMPPTQPGASRARKFEDGMMSGGGF